MSTNSILMYSAKTGKSAYKSHINPGKCQLPWLFSLEAGASSDFAREAGGRGFCPFQRRKFVVGYLSPLGFHDRGFGDDLSYFDT